MTEMPWFRTPDWKREAVLETLPIGPALLPVFAAPQSVEELAKWQNGYALELASAWLEAYA
jgi:hypothetical protein